MNHGKLRYTFTKKINDKLSETYFTQTVVQQYFTRRTEIHSIHKYIVSLLKRIFANVLNVVTNLFNYLYSHPKIKNLS